jgi:hypothetical protein
VELCVDCVVHDHRGDSHQVMSKPASEAHIIKFHSEQLDLASDLYNRIEGSGTNIKKVNDDLKTAVSNRRSEIKDYYASLRKAIDEQEVINLAELNQS